MGAPAPRGLWLSTSHFCSSPWGRPQSSEANAHRPPRPDSTARPVLCGCGSRMPLAGPRVGGLWQDRWCPEDKGRCPPPFQARLLPLPLPSWVSPSPPPQASVPNPGPHGCRRARSAAHACFRPLSAGWGAALRFASQGPRWLLLQLRAPLLVVLRSGAVLCGACLPTQHQCPQGEPAAWQCSSQCPSPI